MNSGKGLALGVVALGAIGLFLWNTREKTKDGVKQGVEGLIGNTPMVRIKSLSDASGCEILGKLEMQNPAGSAKDRVALAIIREAESKGLVRPGVSDLVYEGTSGSTGISLAMLCRARGYEAHIVVPDDTSAEKIQLLRTLGAVVHIVRPAGIVDPNHYVNYAMLEAQKVNNDPSDSRNALFADQFENLANWKAHYETTGPEIYQQANKKIDLFVTGAGTGGTISGVARYLKEKLGKKIKIVLADPQGSGLYNKIKYGVMFNITEREGTRRRHQIDTIVEGIGINRLTKNFDAGRKFIDDAVAVSDTQALAMARYVMSNDGLFIGSSSAINCVAAYECAKSLGPGHTIVTILCDSGSRHLSKFWKQALDINVPNSPDDILVI